MAKSPSRQWTGARGALAGAALVALVSVGRRAGAEPPDEPEVVFARSALCIMPDAEKGWRPCLGRDRDALSYHDFYLLAGRRQIADADDHRWWRREVMIASGVGVAVLGGLGLLPLLAGKHFVPLALSLGLAGGGLTLAWFGSRVSQDPLLDAAEAADLARAQNRDLRGRLGLPPLVPAQVASGLELTARF